MPWQTEVTETEKSLDGEESSEPSTGADDSQPTPNAGYDSYRSQAYSNIMIFVEHDAVPPFRFKAGGWELLQSKIELGPVTKARIAEKGYVIPRVNGDQTGGIELTDLPSRS